MMDRQNRKEKRKKNQKQQKKRETGEGTRGLEEEEVLHNRKDIPCNPQRTVLEQISMLQPMEDPWAQLMAVPEGTVACRVPMLEQGKRARSKEPQREIIWY